MIFAICLIDVLLGCLLEINLSRPVGAASCLDLPGSTPNLAQAFKE